MWTRVYVSVCMRETDVELARGSEAGMKVRRHGGRDKRNRSREKQGDMVVLTCGVGLVGGS